MFYCILFGSVQNGFFNVSLLFPKKHHFGSFQFQVGIGKLQFQFELVWSLKTCRHICYVFFLQSLVPDYRDCWRLSSFCHHQWHAHCPGWSVSSPWDASMCSILVVSPRWSQSRFVAASLLPGFVARCDADIREDASSWWASRRLTSFCFSPANPVVYFQFCTASCCESQSQGLDNVNMVAWVKNWWWYSSLHLGLLSVNFKAQVLQYIQCQQKNLAQAFQLGGWHHLHKMTSRSLEVSMPSIAPEMPWWAVHWRNQSAVRRNRDGATVQPGLTPLLKWSRSEYTDTINCFPIKTYCVGVDVFEHVSQFGRYAKALR